MFNRKNSVLPLAMKTTWLTPCDEDDLIHSVHCRRITKRADEEM